MVGVSVWIMVLTGLMKALDLVGMDGLAAGGDQLIIILHMGTLEEVIVLMITTEEIWPTGIGLCIQTTISTATGPELK